MNKKSFILPIVVGGILLIFVMFAILNLIPTETNVALTGTPADNFSEEQRSKFCGTGNAKSNNYVKEYKIPTDCTLPQAIVTDFDGNIWFVESNTGGLAKFDPILESFTEYENPFWPPGGRSMMWGMGYAPDGT
ncbi:MAG: lyase, partial [Nitrosopumilus sp.]